VRILIADDEQVSRHFLAATLTRWGHEVIASKDGAEALAALQSDNAPQLIILDWLMPGVDGAQICRQVRQWPRDRYTYIILLSTRARMQDIVEGMEAGADDYITKPFDLAELKVRLMAGKRILDLQAELVAAREAFRAQATHDTLTGFWNRGAILDLLARELARAHREGGPVALVMADLDHFKHINDTYGHSAGDAVLSEVTRRMTAAVRPYDTLGRFGGEEFLLVLPGFSEIRAAVLAERIRSRVAGTPLDIPGGPVQCTLSLGVAATGGPQYLGREELLRASDTALYRAKRAGRNCVVRAADPDPTPG